jgi:hypothetical protein
MLESRLRKALEQQEFVIHYQPKVSLRADCGSIAVIAHRRHAHHLTHVDGPGCPLINGEPIGLGSRELNDDDLIELGTCVFQFGPDRGPEPD